MLLLGFRLNVGSQLMCVGIMPPSFSHTHIAWNGGLNGDAGIYSLFMIVVVLVILFLPSDWRL